MNFLPVKCLIGMVHLEPLPGSPRWRGDWDEVIGRAVADAEALAHGGMDAVLVENYGDVPFARGTVEPATVAAMALAVAAVRAAVSLPVGINVLRNDAMAALEIAAVTGAKFIRVNLLSGSMVTDQGLIEGDAYRLLRRRRELRTEVAVFADVLVKHAVPLGEASLEQAAADTAYRGLADSLIVTGHATGQATDDDDLGRVKQAVPDRPVLAGSGVTAANVRTVLDRADGVIVGTSLKREGRVANAVDLGRVREFVQVAHPAK